MQNTNLQRATKWVVLILLLIPATVQGQTNACLKATSFDITSYGDEPYFRHTFCLDSVCTIPNTHPAFPPGLFDSLKVISVFEAIAIACSEDPGFRASWVCLELSRENPAKSIWKLKVEEQSWLIQDAPRKYRIRASGVGNAVGLSKYMLIDAIRGEVKEIKVTCGRYIQHF